MFVEYFEDEPKYRYTCKPKKGFKYAVQITLWDNNASIEMRVEDFMFPFHAWLIETFSYDPKRYEALFDDECDVVFVYFKDNEDRVAFKMIWGENLPEWDDDNECYAREGIRVDSILHLR